MTSRMFVSGGVAISGIFDLEPISLCHLNGNLQLTEREIATLSPIRLNESCIPKLAQSGVLRGNKLTASMRLSLDKLF